MGTTPNLGLATYNTNSGSETPFLTYRLAIAGESSNMSILDSYLGSSGVSGSILSLELSSVRSVDATWSSTNYFTATSTGITTYLVGQIINIKFNVEIAGDTMININGVGNTSLRKLDLQGTKVALENGDLLAEMYYFFIYDGTNFVLMNQLAEHITISGSPSNLLSISGSNTVQDSGIPILIDVTTGSYNAVEIDEYGRVVSGSVMDYSGGSGISSIAGSKVMSDTTGSVVIHNISGISTGSYNQVEVDEYGHVTAGSIVSGGTSGSGITETINFYGSYSGCEIDAYYTITIIDGLITSWNEQRDP